MPRVARVSILAGVVLALIVGTATAGPNSKAKEQLQKGHVAYNLGHYSEAAECYEKAYRFVQDPALLFNVGQAWRLANEPEKAMSAYKGYLRTAGDKGPNKKMAAEHIADLERQVKAKEKQAAAPQQAPLFPTPSAAPKPPEPSEKINKGKDSDDSMFRPLAGPQETKPEDETNSNEPSWFRTADPVVGGLLMLGTQRGVTSKTVGSYHFFGKASHKGVDYEVGYFQLPLFAPNPAFQWSAIYGKVLTLSKWMIEAGALGSHGEFFGGAGKDWGIIKVGARVERIGDPGLCTTGNATYVSPEVLASVPITSKLRANAYGHLRQNIASVDCGFHPSMSTIDVSGIWSANDLLTVGGGLGFYRFAGQTDGSPATSWPDLAGNAGHFHVEGRYDFGLFKAGASFRRIIYAEGVNQLTFDVELRPGRF